MNKIIREIKGVTFCSSNSVKTIGEKFVQLQIIYIWG